LLFHQYIFALLHHTLNGKTYQHILVADLEMLDNLEVIEVLPEFILLLLYQIDLYGGRMGFLGLTGDGEGKMLLVGADELVLRFASFEDGFANGV
jgi:hypothetical protein